MKDKALRMALEALDESVDLVREDYENAKKLYANYPSRQSRLLGLEEGLSKHEAAITAIKQALAEQPAHHTEQPLERVDAFCQAWEQSFTADNPCHTVRITAEDRKHIKAGLKAALAEQPAQRTWVSLSDKDAQWLCDNCRTFSNLIDMTEARVKELNT